MQFFLVSKWKYPVGHTSQLAPDLDGLTYAHVAQLVYDIVIC